MLGSTDLLTHLATFAATVVLSLVAAATAPPASPDAQPLATSCQCNAVVCSNGSTAIPCQVTCPGTAICSCAYCVVTGKISYVSGGSSCMCQ
jgi:hypothetical protein